MDYSPSGSSVHGICQVRILEWVVISSSRGSSWPRDQTLFSCLSGRFLITKPPGKPSYSVEKKESESCVWLFATPWTIYSPWNSPGQNTGVGSLSLLQGIFPIQGSNPGLPHCRQILCQLSHKGSPRILEWVAYPFSRGSSQPRNWIRAPCIAGGCFRAGVGIR